MPRSSSAAMLGALFLLGGCTGPAPGLDGVAVPGAVLGPPVSGGPGWQPGQPFAAHCPLVLLPPGSPYPPDCPTPVTCPSCFADLLLEELGLGGECAEAERYSQDFSTPNPDDWYLALGAATVPEGAGQVLEAGGPAGARATYLRGDAWEDLSLGLRVRVLQGEAGISVRHDAVSDDDIPYDHVSGQVTQRYLVRLSAEGVSLARTEGGTTTQLAAASRPLEPTTWVAVRIAALGGSLRVYLDGALVLDATDPDPLRAGTLALEASPGGRARFDGVDLAASVPCARTWAPRGGPAGGDTNVLAADPSAPGTVYAGLEHAGLWKSADGGQTWVEVGYAGGMSRLGKLTAVAVGPSEGGMVYASWPREVDASGDGGLHWTRSGLMATTATVRALAVRPDNPQGVYAGLGDTAPSTAEGVYRSSDGGRTWQRLSLAGAAFALAIPRTAPGVVFAATLDGISKSTDGGASWSQVHASSGLGPGIPRLSLAVHPGDPNTVYAAAGAVLKSTDGGLTWSQVLASGAQVVAGPQGVVYALSGGKLMRSGDGGATWQALAGPTSDTHLLSTLAVDSADPKRVYLGTGGQGVFISGDSGATWSRPARWTVPANLGPAIAVRTGTGEAYVGTTTGEVWRSPSGGPWSRLGALGSAFSTATITGILLDPSDPSRLFASTLEGVHRSDDGGATWQDVNEGLTDPRVISLAMDPSDTTRLYAGTGNSRPRHVLEGSGLFRSTDGGASWERLAGVPEAPVPAIAVSPSDPSTVYAAVMGVGLYRSPDGGDTWVQVNTGLESACAYTVAVDPRDASVAYAGTTQAYCEGGTGADHVYKTTDAGATWEVVLRGERHTDNVEAIAVDPRNPNNVTVAYHTEKVWFSSDGGAGWVLANRGLVRHGAHLYLWALAPDPAGDGFFLVSCGQGVFANRVGGPESA